MAPVAGSRLIRGEARVTYLKSKYAVLSKPGLDGSIFVVPSHIMGQQFGYPDMHDLLSLNDIVEFEAVPQDEQNGIKWQALDGTVKIKKRASEVEYRDKGVVTFLDERMGQYGFLDTPKGSVWFNANVVRPETKDVAKVLKKGQEVQFVAVKQLNKQTNSNCQYRATLVHGKNWKKPTPTRNQNKTTSQKQSVRPEGGTEGVAAWSSSGSPNSSRPSSPGIVTHMMDSSASYSSAVGDRFGSFADAASSSPLPLSPPVYPWRHPRTQPLDIILSSESDLHSGARCPRPLSELEVPPASSQTTETHAAPPPPLVGLNEAAWSNVDVEGLTNGCSSHEHDSYDRQLIFLQRIAHKLLGISSASQCPVCEPPGAD